MKRLVFAFLIFTNTALSAQINDLLKDDNIVWIGEFSTDFVVEGYKLLDTSDYINTATLLKYMNTKPHDTWEEDKPLMYKIIDANRDSLIPFYYQNTFMNRINLVQGADTIEVIDPTTQEKKKRLVFNCWVLRPDPHYYRAEQILFYDRKKKNFGLSVLAIGLIVDKRNESGEIIGLKEAGWFKTHNYTKKVDLNSPNISLAKRLSTRNNSPCFDTDFKILKNTIGDIQEVFMADMIQNTAIELYNRDDYAQKLSLLEKTFVFKSLQPTRKTDKTFFDEKMSSIPFYNLLKPTPKDDFPDFNYKKDSSQNKIKENRLDAFPDFAGCSMNHSNDTIANYDGFYTLDDQDIPKASILNEAKKAYKLKIVQDWYWDEKLHTIAVRLIGVAPRIKVLDQYGHFMYDESIFYRSNE